MDAVVADEARFIDRSTMGLITTEEHVSKRGPGPAGGRQERGLRPPPGRDGGRGVSAPLARGPRPAGRRRAPAAALRAEPHAPGRLRAGARPTWDGVASLWFAGVAELRAASASAEWARVTADNSNFIDEGPFHSIVTTEHVIVA